MARSIVQRIKAAWRAFEAAQANPAHLARPINAQQSPDMAMEMAGENLRLHCRTLDENHDLAIAVVDDLVTNVVGTGIHVEPQPRLAGQVNQELADRILEAWEEWGRRPEVTGELPWGELQRLGCRAWLRDGEFFAQHVEGGAPYPWGDSVRYRLEFLEADMVPMQRFVDTRGYRHGIYHDAWNRPTGYAVYLVNPYDYQAATTTQLTEEVKIVPVERMLHVKFARRWPQTRGVPICHGIIRRLNDIKDYEESERVAARVAASLAAFIRKNPDFNYPNIDGNVSGEREMRVKPGKIFDDLLPGEEIGTIDTTRPSSELAPFRESQVRALAAGTGTRYSSIARDYNGTYSAQRQELVEAKPHYLRLQDYFVEKFVRPVYERFVRTAFLQGRLQGVMAREPLSELVRAEYIGPGLPWIDPKKEVEADILAVEAGLMTREQVIRKRGGDPRKVEASAQMPRVSAAGEDDDEEDGAGTGTQG